MYPKRAKEGAGRHIGGPGVHQYAEVLLTALAPRFGPGDPAVGVVWAGAGGGADGSETAPIMAPSQGAGDGLAKVGPVKRSRLDDEDRVDGLQAIRAPLQGKRVPNPIGAGMPAKDRASECERGQGPGDAEGRLPKRGRGGGGAAGATSGRRSPVVCAADYLMQGCVTRASKQREDAHQPYKCNVLERMARSFHDFDQTRATHFTVPQEARGAQEATPRAEHSPNASLSTITTIREFLVQSCLNEGADPTARPRIRLLERGVNNGYTEETKFVGDPKKYTVIGENPESREHKTREHVAEVLLNTRRPEYKAYLNVYLEDKALRDQVLRHVETMIYNFPDEVGGSATLPGGLLPKLKGSFCQIFWNPNLETCSGTHWDENDSLLCMLEGRKTVELAPKTASLQIWPGTKEGEKYFSMMRPTHVEQSDTIELLPGEALFLPTGVWHRGRLRAALGLSARLRVLGLGVIYIVDWGLGVMAQRVLGGCVAHTVWATWQ